MSSTEEADYAAFEEKVKRTVYIDNLSPQATESVLKTALNQFGDVQNVQLIASFAEPNNMPHCALVEMQNAKQAKQIVSEMSNFPFMMSGMPRPVRARAAEMGMFGDRPTKPRRRITCCWLDADDPDFPVAKKLKSLVKKHIAEAAFLLKHQLVEEEKLAEHQAEILKANYKKYQLMEGASADGSATDLARHYNMNGFNRGFNN